MKKGALMFQADRAQSLGLKCNQGSPFAFLPWFNSMPHIIYILTGSIETVTVLIIYGIYWSRLSPVITLG